ncbi:MAG: carbohydrate deacetylase [Lachnospiraceae bacterium]
MKIYYHGDDYGVSYKQSKRILECFQFGVLNSISIMPNGKNIIKSIKLLNEVDKDRTIRRSLHINFVEGVSVSKKEQIPDLVDKQGMFSKSFIQVLWLSFFSYHKIKPQLKTEIKAQILYCKKIGCELTAIDSHQHYHMIPAVFDALLEVLEEIKEDNIAQIRISNDPIVPLLENPSMIAKIKPVDMIKWCLLGILAFRVRRKLKQTTYESPVFFGVFYTCKMRIGIVEKLLPSYLAYSKKKKRELELMFHPGNLTERSELLDNRAEGLYKFYTSKDRMDEMECLMKLKDKNI